MSERLILAGIVGSRAFGLEKPVSDTDRMGVFITPTSDLLRLDYKSSDSSRVTSKPDVALFEIGKFLSLCVKGSPNAVEFLFLDSYTKQSRYGTRLVLMRDAFITRSLAVAYGGMAEANIKRANSLRLTARAEDKGDEMNDQIVKTARHAFRALTTGKKLMIYNQLFVRLDDEQRSKCEKFANLATDRHAFEKESVAQMARYHKQLDESRLPAVDMERVNQFLLQARRENFDA